jgi:hypothetical protein
MELNPFHTQEVNDVIDLTCDTESSHSSDETLSSLVLSFDPEIKNMGVVVYDKTNHCILYCENKNTGTVEIIPKKCAARMKELVLHFIEKYPGISEILVEKQIVGGKKFNGYSCSRNVMMESCLHAVGLTLSLHTSQVSSDVGYKFALKVKEMYPAFKAMLSHRLEVSPTDTESMKRRKKKQVITSFTEFLINHPHSPVKVTEIARNAFNQGQKKDDMADAIGQVVAICYAGLVS